MKDHYTRCLDTTLLLLATFAIISAVFIASGSKKSSLLDNSSASPRAWSSTLWNPSSSFMRRNATKQGRTKSKRMEEIEGELAAARALIKEALASANSTSPLEDRDYVPNGDIYRHPHAFHRSYLLMEKIFKIFVYEEGEPPIFHYGLCKDIYSMEGLFLNFMESDHRYRTRDPDGAHIYFLPFSVVMILLHLFDPIVRDKAVMERIVVDYVRIVSEKYPYWNTSEGFDHFMLSCHDWGHRATWYHRKLFWNSIRVLCNANISEYFNPEKDASFPEINLRVGALPVVGGLPTENRTTLAFFAGHSHGKIRPMLLNQWKERDRDVLVYETLPEELDYTEMMRKSKFCLCPSGHEVASPRVVEAIYAGCVPVLISRYYVPPFSDVLDWDKFSLQVPIEDIPNLKRILAGIPEHRFARLREGVVNVRKHFMVNDPPKRYDVFNMIVHSVWLRRLNVRITS